MQPMLVSQFGEAHFQEYSSTILIISDAPCDTVLENVLEGFGVRVLGVSPVADADDALDSIIDVDAVFAVCGSDDAEGRRLIERLAAIASDGHSAVMLTAGADILDIAFDHLSGTPAQLLHDPDAAELASALAVALRSRMVRPALMDVGREDEAIRLQKLGEEVARLARIIDALAEREPTTDSVRQAGSDYRSFPASSRRMEAGDQPSAEDFIKLLRARRLRDQFIPGGMFADPSWDILLDLMVARLSRKPVSVSSLCIAAAVPSTTALRWIKLLTDKGMLIREPDPGDGRRVFVGLADTVADALANWFMAMRSLMLSPVVF